MRAAYCVEHWLRFFEAERRAGRLARGPYLSDVTDDLMKDYIAWRSTRGISNATIGRELAALRASLRHAWKKQRIAAAPFIRGPGSVSPKELVYARSDG